MTPPTPPSPPPLGPFPFSARPTFAMLLSTTTCTVVYWNILNIQQPYSIQPFECVAEPTRTGD